MNKDNIQESLSSIEEIIEDARNGKMFILVDDPDSCLLYTSPSPRDLARSRMPSSA